MATRLDLRFFESTRGRIVTLSGALVAVSRGSPWGLTDDGVRARLARLERAGIVWQRGSVRRASSGGKPAYVYELTPEAEVLFPEAYAPVLLRLLDVLSGRRGVVWRKGGAYRRMKCARGSKWLLTCATSWANSLSSKSVTEVS